MATKSSVKPVGLKPLGARVIIEPIEAGDQTPAGIYLPENAKEKPQKGLVLAIGPGTRDSDGKLIPLDVSVGDQVIFGKYAGSEIKLGDRKLLIMQESDLYAIVVE
jgi:chaperonin GroES